MKKKFIPALTATAVSIVLPFMALAAGNPVGTCAVGSYNAGIETVICQIYHIINIVIPVMIIAAVAYFIYGVIKFVIAGDAEEKSEGRTMMINGIIGFAVIIGLWALVNILLSTFGLNAGTPAPAIPTFQ